MQSSANSCDFYMYPMYSLVLLGDWFCKFMWLVIFVKYLFIIATISSTSKILSEFKSLFKKAGWTDFQKVLLSDTLLTFRLLKYFSFVWPNTFRQRFLYFLQLYQFSADPFFTFIFWYWACHYSFSQKFIYQWVLVIMKYFHFNRGYFI